MCICRAQTVKNGMDLHSSQELSNKLGYALTVSVLWKNNGKIHANNSIYVVWSKQTNTGLFSISFFCFPGKMWQCNCSLARGTHISSQQTPLHMLKWQNQIKYSCYWKRNSKQFKTQGHYDWQDAGESLTLKDLTAFQTYVSDGSFLSKLEICW